MTETTEKPRPRKGATLKRAVLASIAYAEAKTHVDGEVPTETTPEFAERIRRWKETLGELTRAALDVAAVWSSADLEQLLAEIQSKETADG